jgi:hypothetical protein
MAYLQVWKSILNPCFQTVLPLLLERISVSAVFGKKCKGRAGTPLTRAREENNIIKSVLLIIQTTSRFCTVKEKIVNIYLPHARLLFGAAFPIHVHLHKSVLLQLILERIESSRSVLLLLVDYGKNLSRVPHNLYT